MARFRTAQSGFRRGSTPRFYHANPNSGSEQN